MTSTTTDANSKFASTGLAFFILGIASPVILIAATQDIWIVCGPTLVLQVAAMAMGVLGWKSLAGKITVFGSAAMLLLLAAFIGFVAMIVLNSDHPF